MVTVKLGELRFIVDSLNSIMVEKLPVKTAYSLSKLGRVVQKEWEVYEEGRFKLIDRYSAKDEAGRPVVENGRYKMVDPNGFGKEINELGGIEAQIDFNPITLDALGDIQVSPAVLAGLDKFIVGD